MNDTWEAPIERAGSQHQVARELRGIMTRAQDLAAESGAAAAEAEHLLLAIVEQPTSRGGAFLVGHGLDAAAVRQALRAEREHALGTAGVAGFHGSDLAATPRRRKPRWSASARDAWERGFRMARGGRDHVSSLNLVVGLLSAELGTVPRALRLAEIDRDKILGQALVETTKGLTR